MTIRVGINSGKKRLGTEKEGPAARKKEEETFSGTLQKEERRCTGESNLRNKE